MGLPERSLGCARDDETGSGWFLTRFQIAAIHLLPSACPSSTSSQREGMPEGKADSLQSIIGKGTLAAGGFLVTSFRAKSRNLPCPAVIHVSVKMKIDVFVFRFPAVSRRPLWVCQKDPSAALGMTKRGADGFSFVFRSLPSICFLRCVPLQRVRSGEECLKDCGERSSRIVSLPQAGKADRWRLRRSIKKGDARGSVDSRFPVSIFLT